LIGKTTGAVVVGRQAALVVRGYNATVGPAPGVGAAWNLVSTAAGHRTGFLGRVDTRGSERSPTCAQRRAIIVRAPVPVVTNIAQHKSVPTKTSNIPSLIDDPVAIVVDTIASLGFHGVRVGAAAAPATRGCETAPLMSRASSDSTRPANSRAAGVAIVGYDKLIERDPVQP
jgi:hypothetical protein